MGTRGKLDMMQLSIWILFCAGLVWLVIFLLHSVRLESSSLSAFELKRRSDEGDGDAQKATEREQALPRLMTLRRLTETILLVVAIVLTVWRSDGLSGRWWRAPSCLVSAGWHGLLSFLHRRRDYTVRTNHA